MKRLFEIKTPSRRYSHIEQLTHKAPMRSQPLFRDEGKHDVHAEKSSTSTHNTKFHKKLSQTELEHLDKIEEEGITSQSNYSAY